MIKVLILQHPQEPREERGSAFLIPEVLPEARLRVGLSWANFKKAWGLGGEALEAKNFAVLYLGTGNEISKENANERTQGEVFLISKKQWLPLSPKIIAGIGGIILLDGTWSQAKALWWRNSWLLKCQRVALLPRKPSRYGKIRKEPRAECLSTVEALALTLQEFGGDPRVSVQLVERFEQFLKECQTSPHVRKSH